MTNRLCPATHNPADPAHDTRLTGCGRTFADPGDAEGWVDCPHCGLAFKPSAVPTPEQIAAATAPVLLTGDPNTPYEGTPAPFAPNEGLAAGNGGSILFDLTTGKVTRHFPGCDFGPDHAGYLDIAVIDIPSLLQRRGVAAFETGALFDIIECGYTTAAGVYEAPCEPFTPN